MLADHHADVYGLAMHPQRPFALATSSRDTTLRFWTLGMLCPSLPLRAALGLPFTREAAGAAAQAPHCRFLEGLRGAALARRLGETQDELERGALISAFFGCGAGTERLWELARTIEARAVCFSQHPEAPFRESAVHGTARLLLPAGVAR